MLRRAKACLHLLVTGWQSLQVELQGRYSIERLYKLYRYSRHSTALQVFIVLLLTPIPSLLAIVITEVIPLADWRLGLAHSQMFWVRGFLVVFLIAFAVLEQGRHVVPRLPLTDLQLWGSSFVTGVGAAATVYFIATFVGFPVPFTIASGSPACCLLLIICIAIFCGKFLKENANERNRLIKYVLMVAVQVAMTYVYPAYNFVFVRLSSKAQIGFSFLLPVLKIGIKNWIGYLFRGMDDLKPEMVILNAEIFHALFVSWCMQRSASTYTTVLLMVMDFVEATLALRDVGHIMKGMNNVLACAKQRLQVSLPDKSALSTQEAPSLLAIAILIWEKDKSVRENSGIRLASHIKKRYSLSAKSVHPDEGNCSIKSTGNAVNAKIDDLSRGKESDIRQVTQPPDNVLKCSNDDSDVPIVNSYAKNLVDEMSSTERLRYLRSALQVLHIAEFLVLVEMTEVIIPVVYCIYLSIVYHLPNKVYYAQLRGVDDATLQHNLLNVMTYSLLELVSFVMLSYVLQRKVGVSTLRQLAFVMGSQWQVAQCKFVLWVVHSVQAPLDHFGADFSFKFQWLHGNTSSIMGE